MNAVNTTMTMTTDDKVSRKEADKVAREAAEREAAERVAQETADNSNAAREQALRELAEKQAEVEANKAELARLIEAVKEARKPQLIAPEYAVMSYPVNELPAGIRYGEDETVEEPAKDLSRRVNKRTSEQLKRCYKTGGTVRVTNATGRIIEETIIGFDVL